MHNAKFRNDPNTIHGNGLTAFSVPLHPKGLTLKDFITTLRTGHNPNDPPGEILQVMPWPVYGKKTDHELKAIYEFLRSIPSLPNNPSPGP